MTGSKEFLCNQYINQPDKKNSVYYTPDKKKPDKKKPDKKITSERLNMIKQWFKEMTSVSEMHDFKAYVMNIGDAEILVFNKKHNIPDKKFIFAMFERRESMKKIIAEINKIDDEFDREEVGLYAIGSNFFGDYSKAERKRFLKSFGREDIFYNDEN
jgi:hypothetical protein